MNIVLAYTGTGEKYVPSDIVEVDCSATSGGKTITTRRHRFHEAFVLAWRSVYLSQQDIQGFRR